MKTTFLILFVACTLFASCKKDQEDTLPPATQVGAGTFGCKINGKVFIPKGSSGTGAPNPHIQYDYDLNGKPYLSIIGDLYNNQTVEGETLVAYRNITQAGEYLTPQNFNFSVGWPQIIGNCSTVTFDTTIKKWGGGMITKLDIPNRIISGTFDFKFKTQQCDTVYVTEGRFDIKF